MKIYQIDTSARKEGSTSRALAKKLLDKILYSKLFTIFTKFRLETTKDN